jgi:hypothetical protein
MGQDWWDIVILKSTECLIFQTDFTFTVTAASCYPSEDVQPSTSPQSKPVAGTMPYVGPQCTVEEAVWKIIGGGNIVFVCGMFLSRHWMTASS